jgi:crotonobetainyl-CoA:carnitine CoA-transferase CaiB-like acyl-CoA transferase
MLPLENIRILDIQHWLYPGSNTTWILGDLGADVIDIQMPPALKGSSSTEKGQRLPGEEDRRASHHTANRNKKSIWLNLKTDEGREIFYKLAKKSDVIMEGFRPGVTKRLGIDYATISKINPRIIYCSLSGYGQDGPYSQLASHDVDYLGMSGALDIVGEPDGPPVIPPNLIADWGGGTLYSAIGILTALYARTKTGKGQYIDIAYTDGVISMMATIADRYFQTGIAPPRGTAAVRNYPHSGIYETKDGKYVTFSSGEPGFWGNLARAAGRDDLVNIPFVHGRKPTKEESARLEEATKAMRQIFLTKTRDEWFTYLKDKNISMGKMLSFDEVARDPQVLHRDMVIELDHPTEGKVKQVGIAVKLSDTPGKVRSMPPHQGENTEEVLTELGYNKKKIDELYQKEVSAKFNKL